MRENYTLTRLYVEADMAEGQVIDLSKEQAHYLGGVMRMEGGQSIRIFNGLYGEWEAELSEITRKSGKLTILHQLKEPYACPDIWLCFAPVRKHRNAFILEKATELGVARFQPVLTARTQHAKLRLDKMQAQIIEAAEQTERLDLPELHEILALNRMLADWPEDRTLIFADEAGDAKPALDSLKEISGPCALLIGPEGGFTQQERDLLRGQPFVTPVTLGPRILRADTATLSLLTLWQAIQGDWE